MRSGKSDAKDEAENFAANYNTGKFSLLQKQQMVKLCNEMLQKQMQPSIEFYFYMQTINALVANNQLVKFDNWQKTLSGALKKNAEEFKRFLNVSKNVFAENVMLKMGTSVWVCNAADVDLKMEGQATFIFKNLDLICYTQGDTFEILRTNGKYYAGTNQFVGKGGKVDWSRVGLDTARVFAKLNNYTINLYDGLMTADSAMLTYKDKFKEPVMGKVYDKPLGSNQGNKSIYPQFESTSQTFSGITYGKAKYKGGFGLKGALVVGKSSGNQKAELYFYFKNKPVMRIASDEFFVRDNKITNDKVELTIFLDKDSIFHPQLKFTFCYKAPVYLLFFPDMDYRNLIDNDSSGRIPSDRDCYGNNGEKQYYFYVDTQLMERIGDYKISALAYSDLTEDSYLEGQGFQNLVARISLKN
jgi:hypothetical protein